MNAIASVVSATDHCSVRMLATAIASKMAV